MDNDGPLQQNCDPNLPTALCILANTCGYISNAIWFLVLLPQLIKNFRRQSTTGLSFIWASCNFTASLINLFFILDIQVPLFTRISGWYMPILEAGMLLQFMVYSEVLRRRKVVLVGVSVVVYAIIIALEMTRAFGKGDGETSSKMVLVSIVLWSVETYFQVVLNMRRRSVSGQSYISLVLSFIGKTTDVIMQFTLLMPTQYVFMTYFSSTLAYFNFMQLVIYTQPASIWKPVVGVMSLLLCGFVVLLVLRTSVASIVCPIGVLVLLAVAFVGVRRERRERQAQQLLKVQPEEEDCK
ncbi:hypothetical protein BG015_006439 [Linnemannia schmuckeri]|uniref:Uncharacterized protein n=1 Tax=Linnemannia schmuckeri TaxID=64567 RepID=A0A9P5VBT1_9FUNG|nr:hypothetical protein BG015_006439 [Linnemannia schmuckeri]